MRYNITLFGGPGDDLTIFQLEGARLEGWPVKFTIPDCPASHYYTHVYHFINLPGRVIAAYAGITHPHKNHYGISKAIGLPS